MDEATRRALDSLKAFGAEFDQHLQPGPNPERLQRLERILFLIQSSDSYLNEKKNKLRYEVDIWCSAKKWQNHVGGPSALRGVILGNVRSVIQQAEFLLSKR